MVFSKFFRRFALVLTCVLFVVSITPLAFAAGDYSIALSTAKMDAGETTAKLVDSIDLEEFADYYGLTLTEEEEILIRIALMSYSNGAILEHPVGINGIQLAMLAEDPYVGNKSSKKFHYSWCSSVSDIKEKNKVTFSNRDDAVKQGFQPCKRCEP